MSMFCFQCQEAAGNRGCTRIGMCGKPEGTSNLQDLLVYTVKGISIYARELAEKGEIDNSVGRFVIRALFATITNANFDDEKIEALIAEGLELRDSLAGKAAIREGLHDAATWTVSNRAAYGIKAASIGVLSTENEDVRSLRELLTYGVKGMAAYAEHADVLGYEDPSIYNFIFEAMASTTEELTMDEMVAMVLKCGELAVTTMALLDKANTGTYGNPEITEVNIGVGKNPGILISGHDLKDMEELLKQTEGTGVDVYTHSEMLPANYYPAFKKYDHFVGNYGNAWWKQDKEFASFNGPIIMTTNCIVPVKDSYKERIFTTGSSGYPGVKHIGERVSGGSKDFSAVIELAKTCDPPVEIEKGTIVGG
ncbi:MAG: hydroxylamine reductase, partial [Spirochaetales bacterium]|nr:hydroxylamine reductase [Spirochaetales bacterium]